MYEVEQKFRVDQLPRIRESIFEQMTVHDSQVVRQQDLYLAHPCRDFAETDEALRIRITGDEILITYKGPPAFDNQGASPTKTRRETEIAVNLPLDEVTKPQELFDSLGFKQVRQVSKRRENIITIVDGGNVNFALDEVQDLGEFVEIEVIANQGSLEQAQNRVRQISQQFGFCDPISLSYLEMLIEQDR